MQFLTIYRNNQLCKIMTPDIFFVDGNVHEEGLKRNNKEDKKEIERLKER